MNKEEAPMTESESLLLISSMINKAKNRFNETGILYLWWGWLILICCLVQYISIRFFNTDFYYIWFSTWAMLIAQVFIIKKKRQQNKVRTYTEELNGFVWLVFFICFILVFYVAIVLKKPELMKPFMLILYGMPTFLSGVILKFKPLIIGGICCWLLAVVSPFIPFRDQTLLIAAAIICGWIVPGYLLKKKYKKEK